MSLFILTAIISYLGVVSGLIIMRAAAEEQLTGRKFFLFLQKLISVLILFFLLYFRKTDFALILLIAATLGCMLSNATSLIYAALGVILFVSSTESNHQLMQSVLIFMYGVVNSSLNLDLKKKNYVRVALQAAPFLLTSVGFSIFAAMF